MRYLTTIYFSGGIIEQIVLDRRITKWDLREEKLVSADGVETIQFPFRKVRKIEQRCLDSGRHHSSGRL